MSDAFIGGEKMKAYLQRLTSQVQTSASVRVGFLEGSTCGHDNQASAPEVAFYHEFGAPQNNLPSRPFFRIAISVNSAKWGKLFGAALKQANYNATQAMGITGQVMQEQIVDSIEKFTDPALQPETIAAKGFDTPLQDSKNMKRAVSHEVSE